MMIVLCDLDGDTPEACERSMRWQRDAWLAASDWTQTLDAPLTDEQRQAWAVYRQQLRDAPASWTPGPEWDAPNPPGEL